jgi:CBS domain-containing protein
VEYARFSIRKWPIAALLLANSVVKYQSNFAAPGHPAGHPPLSRRVPGGTMSTVYDLVKDRRVYSIDAEKTVLEAARFMMEHSIGALPVLREGQLVGIFSERDVMNRVVAAGRMPGTTKVSEVMTPNPRGVDAEESVEECLFLMKEFGFRHLPIVSGKELKGLVSLRDLLMKASSQQRSVA